MLLECNRYWVHVTYVLRPLDVGIGIWKPHYLHEKPDWMSSTKLDNTIPVSAVVKKINGDVHVVALQALKWYKFFSAKSLQGQLCKVGMDPFPVQWGSKVSTNWSNTWEHAYYCAFMYTFTEKHVCFHVISLFSAHFWPHWKRVHILHAWEMSCCIVPFHAPHAPICTHAGAFVSGIYVTSGWSMSALTALGWGFGLSLLSVVCSVLISLVPMYAFLWLHPLASALTVDLLCVLSKSAGIELFIHDDIFHMVCQVRVWASAFLYVHYNVRFFLCMNINYVQCTWQWWYYQIKEHNAVWMFF